MSCSGRRSWLLAYMSRARWSSAVSGGGARLRGHSRRAATTFASTAYKVNWACRYSQASRPSTMPNTPYSDELRDSVCATRDVPSSCRICHMMAASTAPGSISRVPISLAVASRKPTRTPRC